MFRPELPLNFGWYKKKNGVNFIHMFMYEISQKLIRKNGLLNYV